jgi:hypothetical protein
MTAMTFGKHIGAEISDLPTTYLVWLVGRFWQHPDHHRLAACAYDELMARHGDWPAVLDANARLTRRWREERL